ncbi:MAG: hypothetical protein ONB11_00800 [candidate division KSB1 bacterium]|nr:hypothetical protein [candidate division KSB1 bacterium]
MKHISITGLALLLLIASTATTSAQTANPFGNSGSFTGGLGMTVIDNQTFVTINLRPDIALGKFGLGLNVNLLYNTKNGAIRGEDWNESYDWARLIRYVRYGQKRDKFYTRIGTLDAARLGHGFLMNYYTNEASFDRRKIGLELDMDFGLAGFETVTNNLGRFEVFGARGYARPLQLYTDLPIVKDIAFGATYVTDIDPDSRRGTDDGLNAFGVDVEVPLINMPMFRTYTYFDVAKIDTFGSGYAFGIEAIFKPAAGIAEVSAKLERRILGKEFIPSYFDAFYEIQRFQPLEGGGLARKDQRLAMVQDETRGVFGELVGHVLNTIRLVGNFQRLDQTKKSGVLHLAADSGDRIPVLALQAAYDKTGIETLNDAFTLDDRSIARIGLGYKVKPYLMLFMDYIHSFKYDAEKNKYKAQKRYSPRIAFVYNFGL